MAREKESPSSPIAGVTNKLGFPAPQPCRRACANSRVPPIVGPVRRMSQPPPSDRPRTPDPPPVEELRRRLDLLRKQRQLQVYPPDRCRYTPGVRPPTFTHPPTHSSWAPSDIWSARCRRPLLSNRCPKRLRDGKRLDPAVRRNILKNCTVEDG